MSKTIDGNEDQVYRKDYYSMPLVFILFIKSLLLQNLIPRCDNQSIWSVL